MDSNILKEKREQKNIDQDMADLFRSFNEDTRNYRIKNDKSTTPQYGNHH